MTASHFAALAVIAAVMTAIVVFGKSPYGKSPHPAPRTVSDDEPLAEYVGNARTKTVTGLVLQLLLLGVGFVIAAVFAIFMWFG